MTERLTLTLTTYLRAGRKLAGRIPSAIDNWLTAHAHVVDSHAHRPARTHTLTVRTLAVLPSVFLRRLANRYGETPVVLRMFASAFWLRAEYVRALKWHAQNPLAEYWTYHLSRAIHTLRVQGNTCDKIGSRVRETILRREAFRESENREVEPADVMTYDVWLVTPTTGEKSIAGRIAFTSKFNSQYRLSAFVKRNGFLFGTGKDSDLPTVGTSAYHYVGRDSISGSQVWLTLRRESYSVTVVGSRAEMFADTTWFFPHLRSAQEFAEIERDALSPESTVTIERTEEPVFYCDCGDTECNERELAHAIQLIFHPLINDGEPTLFCDMCGDIAFQGEPEENAIVNMTLSPVSDVLTVRTSVIVDGEFADGLAYPEDGKLVLTGRLNDLSDGVIDAIARLRPVYCAVNPDGEITHA